MRNGKTPRFTFQPLTCIRQTGIARKWDGTTTYTFLAEVSQDAPPVRLTLTVTTALALSAAATFEKGARDAQGDYDGHSEREVPLDGEQEAS